MDWVVWVVSVPIIIGAVAGVFAVRRWWEYRNGSWW